MSTTDVEMIPTHLPGADQRGKLLRMLYDVSEGRTAEELRACVRELWEAHLRVHGEPPLAGEEDDPSRTLDEWSYQRGRREERAIAGLFVVTIAERHDYGRDGVACGEHPRPGALIYTLVPFFVSCMETAIKDMNGAGQPMNQNEPTNFEIWRAGWLTSDAPAASAAGSGVMVTNRAGATVGLDAMLTVAFGAGVTLASAKDA